MIGYTKSFRPNRGEERTRWLRLIATLSALIVLSIGLAYLTQNIIAQSKLPLYEFDWLAYLIVFGMSVLANLSVVVPVPFAVSIMIAAATRWDPVIIVLLGATGGTIGELSGYYAGYLGKKLAIPEHVWWLRRVEQWIQRYGVWAIFFLALQPIVPFDIGGFIAGTARMPVRKFFLALWLGKIPKYALFVYGGVGLINMLPFFSPP